MNNGLGVAGIIGWGLEQLFGGQFIESACTAAEKILEALMKAVDGGEGNSSIIDVSFSFFSGIAISLLIIFFFMNVYSQISKDMFTMEKLIIFFIQFLFAFAVVLCLKDILGIFFDIGYNFFHAMNTKFSSVEDVYNVTFWGCSTVEEAMSGTNPPIVTGSDGYSSGWRGLLQGFQPMFITFIVGLFCFIARIAVMFAVFSVGIMILVRTILSPIAVVQLYSGGDVMHSNGMMYLKRLVGDLLTFGVIVLILYCCNLIAVSWIPDLPPNITKDTIKDVLTVTNLVPLIVPKLAAIGAVTGASRFARELVGAS